MRRITILFAAVAALCTMACSPASALPASEESTPDAGPLYLTMSIHVEGWTGESRNEALFAIHRDGLLRAAQEAAETGVILNFELGPEFMRAVAAFEDSVLEDIAAMGHGFAIHADAGGRGTPSLASFTAQLRFMRLQAQALGVDTTAISGICSRGPWVEAALAAGFETSTGAVAYCMTSLDEENVPDGVDLSECTTPIRCHGAIPMDDAMRIHPFYASDSSDFLAGADDGLLLFIGTSGDSFICRGTSSGCTADNGDLAAFVGDIEAFLAGRDPGQVAVLSSTFSMGSIPPEGWMASLGEAVQEYVESGAVEWASVEEAAGMVREAGRDG